jgi:hypothetical protein
MGNGTSKKDVFIYDSEENFRQQNSPHEMRDEAVHPNLVYRVSALKHFFDVLPDTPMKNRTLRMRVTSTNFVSKRPWYICCQRIITKVILNHKRSDLTIEESFKLMGLQDDCEIGIGYEVQTNIQTLTNWEKHNPHSPLLQPSSPFTIDTKLGYVHHDNTMPVLQL